MYLFEVLLRLWIVRSTLFCDGSLDLAEIVFEMVDVATPARCFIMFCFVFLISTILCLACSNNVEPDFMLKHARISHRINNEDFFMTYLAYRQRNGRLHAECLGYL